MNRTVQSDLAKECYGFLGGKTAGITRESVHRKSCDIERFCVITQEAASKLGKPVGSYTTLETADCRYLSTEDFRLLSRDLASELRRMTESSVDREINGELDVLVVGLGNDELTADAIGPRSVATLPATRHLKKYDPALYQSLGCCSLTVITPGVVGKTGVETSEQIHAAVDLVKPDLIIAVDALAAASVERLACTIQLTDTGIVPGSGVGNRRGAITKSRMGVPVIAVGVPTVVDSSTLVYDALSKAGVETVPDPLTAILKNKKSFFVSPKECDLIVDHFSRLIARAIEIVFVGELLS